MADGVTDFTEDLTLDQRLDLRELEVFLNLRHDPFLEGHSWDTSGLDTILDRLTRRLSAEPAESKR